jgi:hypothetical protein
MRMEQESDGRGPPDAVGRRFTARILALACGAAALAAEPGGPAEPVRVVHDGIDLKVHDGGLRPAIGVENIQVLRAHRTQPESADGFGWTYNHAPMLAYAHGRFYLQYLSNPFGEHVPPGQTLLVTSPDGRQWHRPRQVFPIYLLRPGPISGHESGLAIMHQRMGFYVAPNGRLLVLGHYGHAPSPTGVNGIGRVVREVYADASFGPIHFIRYNAAAGRTEANTPRFPFYARSPDQEFVAACDALLADQLKTMQWREEDRSDDGFYTTPGSVLQAPSVFHRKDGVAVALWKHSWSALSHDHGRTWSQPVQVPSIVTGGAKTWGQRTADGRYAMVYNPVERSRWPLAVVTSDDGVTFGDMLLINGEVPPRRYFGRAKDFGVQYVRGIAEGNGTPPGQDLWVTYSGNKEDMWVSRVPLPIRHEVTGPVHDTFDGLDAGGRVPEWNLYRPRWADVRVEAFPSADNKCLRLEDRDPWDYAKAVRVFAESKSLRLEFSLWAGRADTGRLEIEVLDHRGRRPIRLSLAEDGRVRVATAEGIVDVGPYRASEWLRFSLVLDTTAAKFDLALNGQKLLAAATFAEAAATVERFSLRTGAFRHEPTRQTDRYAVLDDLPDPDQPLPPAVFCLDEVVIEDVPGSTRARR